jgi:Family of unknown function (DUF6636)
MRPGIGASLLAAAAVLAGCGGGTTTVVVTSTASSSPATSTATSSTQITTGSPQAPTTTSNSTTTAAAATVHFATFKSPSANIGCMIIGGTARCDIKKKSWPLPARPSTCPKIVDFGQGMIVTGSGSGHLVCAGDTVLDPTAKVVPYNTDTIVGAFRCESRTSGMTCTNTRTGHGFFLSIQTYRAF